MFFRKNQIMLAAGMLGTLQAYSVEKEVAKAKQTPNVLLIVADDLGYGDLNFYGAPHINTPNIDALSKKGVVFTDFHSNGAVCSPTRAALLSGLYQQRVGIEGVVKAKTDRHKGMKADVTTIADELKRYGYHTGMFGKWHLGYDTIYNPVKHGFDEFNGFLSGNVDYHSHIDQAGFEDWYNKTNLEKREGYTTDLITDDAIDFIERNKEEPFFLYLPYETPHYPYQDRESKADRMVGGKPNVDFPLKGSEENYEETYAEMIRVLDENIGRLMVELEESNLSENTIIIFCSDNGASKVGNCGGLRGTKSTVWEGGHRVPAFAVWEGKIPAKSNCNETVLTFDIYPTILDIVGGKSTNTHKLDGTSFRKAMVGKKKIKRKYLVWRHGHQYAVRKGDLKLVVDSKTRDTMLFDLKTDLAEQYNLAKQKEKTVKQLVKYYKKWNSSIEKQ